MKIRNEHYGIDANVILRLLVKDDVKLAEQAKAIFTAIEEGKITAYLDPVILAEVVWVLKSFYKRSPSEIATSLLTLLKSDHIFIVDQECYITALEMFEEGHMHFGDACACAVANRMCDGQLFSFDRKLDRVPGIQRIEKLSEKPEYSQN